MSAPGAKHVETAPVSAGKHVPCRAAVALLFGKHQHDFSLDPSQYFDTMCHSIFLPREGTASRCIQVVKSAAKFGGNIPSQRRSTFSSTTSSDSPPCKTISPSSKPSPEKPKVRKR